MRAVVGVSVGIVVVWFGGSVGAQDRGPDVSAKDLPKKRLWDGLVGEPAWRGKDPLAKLKVLARYDCEGFHCPSGPRFELITEYLLARSKGLPLERRSGAWLAALEDLVRAGFDDPSVEFGSVLGHLWETILLEHLRLDPKVRRMSPRQQLKHLNVIWARLNRLRSVVIHGGWSRTLQEHLGRVVLVDASFIAAKLEQRRARIEGLRAEKLIDRDARSDLVGQYTDRRTAINGWDVDLLAALRQEPGYAQATPEKRLTMAAAFLAKRDVVNWLQVLSVRRTLTMDLFVATFDPTKPLSPKDELAFWSKLDREHGDLAGTQCNIRLQMAHVAFLLRDPTCRASNPLGKANRLAALHKMAAAGFDGTFERIDPLLAEAAARAAAGLPRERRGAARLRVYAQSQRAGLTSKKWRIPGALREHLAFHTGFQQGTARQRLKILGELEKTLRVEGLRGILETPYAVAMLKGDPAFLAADPKGKEKIVEGLVERGVISSHYSGREVLRKLGVE